MNIIVNKEFSFQCLNMYEIIQTHQESLLTFLNPCIKALRLFQNALGCILVHKMYLQAIAKK